MRAPDETETSQPRNCRVNGYVPSSEPTIAPRAAANAQPSATVSRPSEIVAEEARTTDKQPTEAHTGTHRPIQRRTTPKTVKALATAGVKWSVIGQFENVARKGDRGPVPSSQAAKKTVNQRDIEEDARRSPALPLRPFPCTFGTALTALNAPLTAIENDHRPMSPEDPNGAHRGPQRP